MSDGIARFAHHQKRLSLSDVLAYLREHEPLHASMLAQVEVLPADEYDAWVDERAGARLALGKESFQNVCAKCHGIGGEGDIGPNIAQSGLLEDRAALANVIRNGVGTMPAVGRDWPREQVRDTIAYLQQRFGQQRGGSGGGQG